jgi:hypothetical protein
MSGPIIFMNQDLSQLPAYAIQIICNGVAGLFLFFPFILSGPFIKIQEKRYKELTDRTMKEKVKEKGKANLSIFSCTRANYKFLILISYLLIVGPCLNKKILVTGYAFHTACRLSTAK